MATFILWRRKSKYPTMPFAQAEAIYTSTAHVCKEVFAWHFDNNLAYNMAWNNRETKNYWLCLPRLLLYNNRGQQGSNFETDPILLNNISNCSSRRKKQKQCIVSLCQTFRLAIETGNMKMSMHFVLGSNSQKRLTFSDFNNFCM